MTNLGFGLGPQAAGPLPAFAAQIGQQVLVVQGEDAELAVLHALGVNERLDVGEQVHLPTMGDISPVVNSHIGKFRACRWIAPPVYISPMAEIDYIRGEIERAMKVKGFSRRSLSKAADLSETAVRDLLSRTDNPGIGTLRRIAEALEMPVDQLTGAALMVPVLGNIGAGGEVLFTVDPDNELNEAENLPLVPRPPLIQGRLMALAVVGSSMLPKYEDGDVVYVRRDHDGILPTYLNRYCAVRTGDGGTWLKILSPGSQAGRYTLRSLNAPDMENVEVEWASPVLFTMAKLI